MADINFGSGTLIGRRSDVSNPTPAQFGILQDVQIDMDRTLKELIGQYQFPVDVAQASFKITGKAKFARIQANVFNDLFLGQTLTPASGEVVEVNEAGTVPGSSTYTITVSGSATFDDDLGVYYATTGVQFTRVAAASEAVGKYSVNESTGVYTFAAADASVAVLINYSKTVTTLKRVAINNVFMGVGPSFEVNLMNAYTNNAGVDNKFFLKLYACKSSKLSLPFKNTEYTIQEMDFQAYANVSGQVGMWATTE